LRTRIVSAIGLALGRQVDVSSVHMRVLPHPGFDLENFVVHDDPAFSAEPVIRSQQVTAELRVSSLLRGRLEISRLSLTEPSLNLVRDRQGRWNLENFLERAAQIPVAPTKKRTPKLAQISLLRPIAGRINLKLSRKNLMH
jgi:AsmA protein